MVMDLDGVEFIAEQVTPTADGRREVYLAPQSIRELKSDPRVKQMRTYAPKARLDGYVFSIADIDVFQI